MTNGLPFDDFRNLLSALDGPDERAAAGVRSLYARTGKPKGSLGRLEDIAEWLAAWTGRVPPVVNSPLVAVFAGNHGVAARHDISPRSSAATARMVELTAAGGAAINQFCVASNLGLKVFDLALEMPTADIAEDAALDERACAATMAFGMEAVAGTDLLCIGDLGVGNSTVAAALFAALLGGSGADWVGSGSGAGDAMMARKAAVVDAALRFHGNHLKDPLEALRRVGGREFAAIAGAILAARKQRVAVILDGFATTAAAAVLHAVNPAALDHCVLAHLSAEPGHARAASQLGLRPILDLQLHHGEGTGAALAAGIVRAAALSLSGMAAAIT